MIGHFLQLNSSFLLPVVAVTFIFDIPLIINRAILQGLLRFYQLVFTHISESLLKLVVGILLVFIGLQVFGAVVGIMLSLIFGFILAKYFIRDYLWKYENGNVKIKPFITYLIPIILASFSTTSLFTSDLILVKHFFQPSEAGQYAALSTLGKIVFAGTGPIGYVMFPLVVRRQANNQNHTNVFNFSLAFALVIVSIIIAFYWLFPHLVIKILYGSRYLEVADLLVWIGVFMGFVTLINLIVNYFLSLGKMDVVVFTIIGAVIQIIGIWLFHFDLETVIKVSLIVTASLLVVLTFYYHYQINFKKTENYTL